MKRRKFLQYTTLGTTSGILAACSGSWFNSPNSQDHSPLKFGKLERTYLTLGYLPSTAVAPLIIAQEKGIFARYGLIVAFSRQLTPDALEDSLKRGKLDAAVTSYALPLVSYLKDQTPSVISLMTVSLNGSAITLSKKAWIGGIRPAPDYRQFRELSAGLNRYIATLSRPSLGIPANASMEHYLSRYWLAAMGIDPDRQVQLTEIPPAQMIYKMQSGTLLGYTVPEPWNQQAVWEKAGFTVDISRNIWKGHPSQILATMAPWAKNNPTTARTLVAALLEACQYCDDPKNRPEIAEILAQKSYLNSSLLSLEPSLLGNYSYHQLDNQEQVKSLPDFNIFHYQNTNYLQKPNHANYPWRSHGVWLLTQMTRWHQEDLSEYPADADKILAESYPLEIYEDVAKTLKLELPKETLKKEPATAFIDQRSFDPSNPIAYLNQFELRANKPQLYGLYNS